MSSHQSHDVMENGVEAGNGLPEAGQRLVTSKTRIFRASPAHQECGDVR